MLNHALKIFKTFFISLTVLCFFSCQDETPKDTDKSIEKTEIKTYVQQSPNFNSDSAYLYTKQQVDFGTRITGTVTSLKCANWIEQKFKKFGAKTILQKGTVTNWDKSKLNIVNIIAQVNPNASKRILLTAHWDTRPYADNDPQEANHNKPLLGADDGASGVAIMLEIARILSQNKIDIGVDFICFDAEDLGKSDFENSYCLGTQYWGKNLLPKNYTANYAINLDMVGGKGATFNWERNSITQGEAILRKVWEKAAQLGYSNFFQYIQAGQITDDHLYVHQYTKIPAIDIIHFNNQTGFPAWWHTINDNMNNIDPATLKAVGQTLLEVIYTEPK